MRFTDYKVRYSNSTDFGPAGAKRQYEIRRRLGLVTLVLSVVTQCNASNMAMILRQEEAANANKVLIQDGYELYKNSNYDLIFSKSLHTWVTFAEKWIKYQI